MALRVLLADESPTIKKVFQLSLQDYAVEVKSVNVGGDVLEVANDFKPDIVFADVLLQQMSGYQVSSEIKVAQELKEIPVVLMWSGFMDIDEDKFQASHADAKLEKPFDVENLRGLVQKLVPKVQSQNLSDYLDFPDLPEFDEKAAAKKQKAPEKKVVATPPPQAEPPKAKNVITTPPPVKKTEESKATIEAKKQTPPPTPPAPEVKAIQEDIKETNKAEENSQWNMEAFEAVDLSQQMPTRVDENAEADQELLADNEEDSDWVQGNIESFKLNVNINDDTNVEEEEVPVDTIVPESAVDAATKASSLIPPVPKKQQPQENIQLDDVELEIETPVQEQRSPSLDISDLPQLSEERLTDLIRAQSKEIVERVVWQVVPELATQIIERELKRLLEEQNSKLR